MRVRVCYTVEADDEYRRAIRNFYGMPGLATRQEVRDWLEANGSSSDADIVFELQQKEKRASEED